MKKEYVTLVDVNDVPTGTMEKMEAHKGAHLHRAVSVFIVNSKGEWLLQQRAYHKYHSGGLWTNSCCTHPYPGETGQEAAQRRLKEELGMSVELKKLFHFTYLAPLDNQLTEHELDHVFVGYSDQRPTPNPDEVNNVTYLSTHFITTDTLIHPHRYTEWFKIMVPKVANHLMQ